MKKEQELYKEVLELASYAEDLERQRDDGKRQFERAVDALMNVRTTRPTDREIALARKIKELVEAAK